MRSFHTKKITLIAALAAIMLAPFLAIAQISWVKSLDAALKQAEKENKFIVLDVSASW